MQRKALTPTGASSVMFGTVKKTKNKKEQLKEQLQQL